MVACLVCSSSCPLEGGQHQGEEGWCGCASCTKYYGAGQCGLVDIPSIASQRGSKVAVLRQLFCTLFDEAKVARIAHFNDMNF